MISKYNPPLPPYPPPPLPRQPPLPGTPPLPLSSPLMLPLLLQTPQNTYFPSFQAQKVETRHDQFSQSIKTPYFETRSFEPIDKRIVYQSMHRNATPESSNYCFIEPRKTLYEAVCDAWGSVELCMDANAPIWTAADEEISSTESPTSSSSSHTWNDSINAQFDSLWVEEFFNDVNDTKFQLSENLSNQGTCEETDEEIEAEISESISNSGTKMSARRFYALPVNSLFPSLCSQSASKLRASARHVFVFLKLAMILEISSFLLDTFSPSPKQTRNQISLR